VVGPPPSAPARDDLPRATGTEPGATDADADADDADDVDLAALVASVDEAEGEEPA
ncbi:MAG: hypothetical protein HKN41_06240, partial [Ilumatobacter sp.]|nr:hypothetical protein [Ilumatobacter sp.]